MILHNDWYGHKEALARYCGIDGAAPAIFGSMTHGWSPDIDAGYASRSRWSARIPLFVWNLRHLDQARSWGASNVHCVGAPAIYELSHRDGDTGQLRRGTLVLPEHRSDGERAAYDTSALISEVEASHPGPWTVSIFYQDLANREVTEAYVSAGWRIVTFGTRYDPCFLPRLLSALDEHESVVSTVVSTGLWYGAFLGLRVRVLDLQIGGKLPNWEPSRAELRSRWPALHADGIAGDDARALGGAELGADQRLAPDDLRSVLGWDSWRAPVARTAREVFHLLRGRTARRIDQSYVATSGAVDGGTGPVS